MKKLYLLLLSFLALHSQAQWVSIPDTNFVSWLNAHGYSQCMNGNQIDTMCNSVTNAITLDCSYSSINDITGITYFDNLQYLYCDNNALSFLPSLPPLLKYLACGYNQLLSLPSLPGTLDYLGCYNNPHLTALPSLPNNMTGLDCGYDSLTVLPSLPGALRQLICRYNFLQTLPMLPASLNSLECDFNFIDSLPSLPLSLGTLYCNHNQLSQLPVLPGTLGVLHCADNQLVSLPTLPSLRWFQCNFNQISNLPQLPVSLKHVDFGNNPIAAFPSLPDSLLFLSCRNINLRNLPVLPDSLGFLDCSLNQLTSLPALPNSIHSLRCTNNQLTSLPELPDSLESLFISWNPNLYCLPKLKRILTFSFDPANIQCLPNYGNITSSNPPLSTVPLCGANNNNGCDAFWNISGRAYYDGDSNCIKNIADTAVRNVKVKLTALGNLVQQSYTGGEGYYSFDNDSAGVYMVSVDTSSIPFYVSCPASNLFTDSITTVDSFNYNNNFALQCKPGFDLAAWSIWGFPFRPANFTTVYIHAGDITNFYGVHCAAGVSGIVTTTITGPASYLSPANGALTPDTISGGILTYNVSDFGSINFFEDFNIVVQTDTTAQIGDIICFTVSVSPISGDNNPGNNSIKNCFSVVGSFDPNEKSVYPAAILDSTQHWLTYTIRFQNTGTAEAQHIYVTDTLDAGLDPSSFQLLDYSHEPIVQITGNAVRFNFPNINLPDSNVNEPASHGYVQYKVKLHNNLSNGTQINNTAYIYFDFNAPVVTNTTTNTIACPVIITSLSSDICPGTSYNFNGTLLTAPGVYTDSLTDVNGCDSIIELTLNVHSPTLTTISTEICEYEVYSFHGVPLNFSGVYYDTLSSVYGCDSVVELTLTVLPALVSSISASICEGDVYAFGGMLLSTAGVYHDSLTNNSGCDSVIVLTLSVLSSSVTGIGDAVCEGKFYDFNGTLLSDAGLYYDTLTNVNGCDSVVALTLYTRSSSYTSLSQHICEGDTFFFRNTPLTTAGMYLDTLLNAGGCDSIITLQLEVEDPIYTISYLGSDTLVFTGSGSVQWVECGTETVWDTSHVFAPGIINAFAAIVTGNSCTDTSQCYSVGFDNISTITSEHVKMYPNPAGDFVIVEIEESLKGSSLRVTDARGRIVAAVHLFSVIQKLETNNYASGMYYLTISSPGRGQIITKVAVSR